MRLAMSEQICDMEALFAAKELGNSFRNFSLITQIPQTIINLKTDQAIRSGVQKLLTMRPWPYGYHLICKEAGTSIIFLQTSDIWGTGKRNWRFDNRETHVEISTDKTFRQMVKAPRSLEEREVEIEE
jgi:hypothetical protein